MTRVNLEVVKPWITAKVNDILGMEDGRRSIDRLDLTWHSHLTWDTVFRCRHRVHLHSVRGEEHQPEGKNLIQPVGRLWLCPFLQIMQINLTGFLNAKRAREFMGELW